MKFYIILLSLNFWILPITSNAQDLLTDANNQTITSILSSSTQPLKVTENEVKEIDNTKVRISSTGGKSETIVTRKVIIKKEATKNNIAISINRIQQKGTSFEGTFDIDTDSPFPNNQTEKMTIEHYNQFIKRTFNVEWNKNSLAPNFSNYNNSLWNMDFPKLHSIKVFSGILFSVSEKEAWTDSLYDEKGIYINNYQKLEETNKTYKIALKGHYIKKNSEDIDVENQKKELPKAGETIQAKTLITSMDYTGDFIVNKKTGIIENSSIKLNKSAKIGVLGQTVSKDTQTYYSIENKFK